MKKALITGVTGQDGAYLAKHLIEHSYRVFGTFRRSGSVNFWRLAELGVLEHEGLQLIEFDVTDPGGVQRVVRSIGPDEVYNLAAQSFVGVSFEQPITTAQITGVGALNILEAIREVDPGIRFYQASTSEMFGLVQHVPQSEQTPFYPRSPYGVAKLFAHWSTVNYRESHGIFAASGILFNHESPLRGREFVTRKISHAVASIAAGQLETLELGNLDAKRDWGFAGDYVAGMHAMLQAERPDTYVLATGRTETVRHFVEICFQAIGVELDWRGTAEDEKGYDRASGALRVAVNPAFYRPAEVDLLIGDPSRARNELGWQASMPLETLAQAMVEADMARVARGYAF